MTEAFTTKLPDDYPALLQVSSLKELFDAADKVGNEVNIIVWRRGEISGAFNALSHNLSAHYGRDIDQTNPNEMLSNERFGPSGDIGEAFAKLKKDIESFRSYITKKSAVRWVGDLGYEVDFYEGDFVDDFHTDIPAWRLMCCYNNPTTEWIKNEDVLRKSGLAYIARDDAVISRFAQGDVWLHAGTDNEERHPFIHRGPKAAQYRRRLLFAS